MIFEKSLIDSTEMPLREVAVVNESFVASAVRRRVGDEDP
jgi:hypothetical protein